MHMIINYKNIYVYIADITYISAENRDTHENSKSNLPVPPATSKSVIPDTGLSVLIK